MKFRLVTSLLAVLLISLLAMACQMKENDRVVAERTQADVMERAVSAVPPYRPTQFPAREDINWYLRETESRDTWYTYALNMQGEPLFYVVSDMKPRNICVHLTTPDRVVDVPGEPDLVMSAPALDGVYYGNSGCQTFYLRDAATGNFIEVSGNTFTLVSSKVPLAIETDELFAR